MLSIADFLYRTTGRNIFKPLIAEPRQKASDQAEPMPSIDQPVANADSGDVIHIGPRGGRYKLDANGRKIYLKSA